MQIKTRSRLQHVFSVQTERTFLSEKKILINVKAVDNASDFIADASHKISATLKEVTVSLAGLATASFNLYNAYDNVADSTRLLM